MDKRGSSTPKKHSIHVYGNFCKCDKALFRIFRTGLGTSPREWGYPRVHEVFIAFCNLVPRPIEVIITTLSPPHVCSKVSFRGSMPPDPPSVQALLQVALFCEMLLTWMNLLAFDEAVGVGTGGFTRVVPLASSCSNLLFSSSFLAWLCSLLCSSWWCFSLSAFCRSSSSCCLLTIAASSCSFSRCSCRSLSILDFSSLFSLFSSSFGCTDRKSIQWTVFLYKQASLDVRYSESPTM